MVILSKGYCVNLFLQVFDSISRRSLVLVRSQAHSTDDTRGNEEKADKEVTFVSIDTQDDCIRA
jgi:hypothetical protein